MIVILMGVAGSGKTTVGRSLAQELGWAFYDADDFHLPANVEKMRRGVALTDADRAGWLKTLRGLIDQLIAQRQNALLACSALKRSYQAQLIGNGNDVRLVYLKASADVLQKRLNERRGHFFNAQLLESQLATLEEPIDAITADAAKEPVTLVAEIRRALGIR